MDIEKQEWIKKNLTNTAPFGSELKVGDMVRWVNDYGVVWEHKIIGFNYDRQYNSDYKCFVHLDSCAYWFPHDHKTLTKINN